MSQGKLKSITISGLIWSVIDLISKQGIQLIVQIVLARLLLPEHFGLIGMITIFIALSTALVQSGLDQALIREKKPGEEDYSTIFYFNLMVSIIIYIILFIMAPYIALFFEELQLIKILRVITLVIIINSLSVIQRVFLIRDLDFKTQTKVSAISGVVSGVIAIIMAFYGAGVWSLVAQQVIFRATESILLFSSNRWLPSLKFNIILFKHYFNFGYKLLLSGLIDTFYKNIYSVIIGKVYPASQLGYFTNATKLRDVSSQSITQAIQKVTYPVLSSIQDDEKRLALNYKRIITMSAFLFFPFMLGLVAISPTVIPFLLGEKWIPSVPFFQLLSIAGLLYPIHAINLNILKVKNRSDLFLYLELIKKVILTVLIILAFIIGNSIEDLIFALIVQSFFALIINTYFSGREINYPLRQQLKDMLPSFVNSVIMALIVYYISSYLTNWIVVNLVIQIILGVLIYIALSFVLNKKDFYAMVLILKENNILHIKRRD